MSDTILRAGLQSIESQRGRTDRLHNAYRGKSPVSYISEDAAESLEKRLRQLSVNFPRLVVDTLAERTRVESFRRVDSTAADMDLWKLWRAAGLEAKSGLAHQDRLLYGAAYVTVWGHRERPRTPVVMVSSPREMTVDIDPATGEVRSGVRVWKETDGTLRALTFEQDGLHLYSADSEDLAASGPWKYRDTYENPWGYLPIVPLVRQASAVDQAGTSVAADVLDLTDALSKVLQDSMVTSEYHSRPRRWATGLEIVEDDDGNPIDPFGQRRLMQSEDPETKFGQLPPTTLDGYADMSAMLTQHIGSLSGLPPHYLGLHGDQPPNADAVRASETQLVMRALAEQRQLGAQWAQVAAWLETITEGSDPAENIVTQWANPEISTPAARADAAGKLYDMGVPLRTLLRDPLSYEPHEIDQIVRDQGADLALRTAFSGRARGGE